MAPYYPFAEDQFSRRGVKDPLVTLNPYVLPSRTPLNTIISFVIAVFAGVSFGLIVVCAICKIGWFRPREPEIIGLPDWSQVQWRRIRMRVYGIFLMRGLLLALDYGRKSKWWTGAIPPFRPQLSTITDWESNPGSPEDDLSTDDQDGGSINAPLLEAR